MSRRMPIQYFNTTGLSSSSSSSLLLLLLLKCLALKAGHLRQASRPEGTFTQAVKQPYVICCLPGHVFKEVQWGNVSNMNMMSRNISSLLSFAYLTFSFGS